ncbi:carbohydrate-binding protein [Streptomyces sp. A3M-1-3]|uniref:CBM35 domain-containing protein n=1 Tax=Streptomyces sp. A3M-1-3 TaxID=2962044 RepID=UPI0020B7AD0C|nr:CBM35 domain-containing protein [Streptomyces sp. A3M-1-3]MCP3822059.1 carbohydrate-binding protein [Streptomyces sp. A3M-1-3]
MTPANNGAGTPEDDDPFGYLYADGQAAGATPPSSGGYGYPGPASGGAAQPGVPRTSYNHVRTVGDRTYGGARAQVPPQAQYQAPEALRAEGYAPQPPTTQNQPVPGNSGGRGRGSGGPNTKGLLIGAVAVVAAVVIGIGIALASGDDDPKDKPQAGNSGGNTAPQSPNPEPSKSEEKPPELPKTDATGPGLVLAGGAAAESTVPGAKSAGGSYVGGFNQVGASVTWTVDVTEAGAYRVYLRYGTPGEDATSTLSANGKANTSPLNMENFGDTPKGDWEKGWKTTWGQVNLNKGTNTIKISCEQGNQCNAALDQLWITGANG